MLSGKQQRLTAGLSPCGAAARSAGGRFLQLLGGAQELERCLRATGCAEFATFLPLIFPLQNTLSVIVSCALPAFGCYPQYFIWPLAAGWVSSVI